MKKLLLASNKKKPSMSDSAPIKRPARGPYMIPIIDKNIKPKETPKFANPDGIFIILDISRSEKIIANVAIFFGEDRKLLAVFQ